MVAGFTAQFPDAGQELFSEGAITLLAVKVDEFTGILLEVVEFKFLLEVRVLRNFVVVDEFVSFSTNAAMRTDVFDFRIFEIFVEPIPAPGYFLPF